MRSCIYNVLPVVVVSSVLLISIPNPSQFNLSLSENESASDIRFKGNIYLTLPFCMNNSGIFLLPPKAHGVPRSDDYGGTQGRAVQNVKSYLGENTF
jgi:hypothetical protein